MILIKKIWRDYEVPRGYQGMPIEARIYILCDWYTMTRYYFLGIPVYSIKKYDDVRDKDG